MIFCATAIIFQKKYVSSCNQLVRSMAQNVQKLKINEGMTALVCALVAKIVFAQY